MKPKSDDQLLRDQFFDRLPQLTNEPIPASEIRERLEACKDVIAQLRMLAREKKSPAILRDVHTLTHELNLCAGAFKQAGSSLYVP